MGCVGWLWALCSAPARLITGAWPQRGRPAERMRAAAAAECATGRCSPRHQGGDDDHPSLSLRCTRTFWSVVTGQPLTHRDIMRREGFRSDLQPRLLVLALFCLTSTNGRLDCLRTPCIADCPCVFEAACDFSLQRQPRQSGSGRASDTLQTAPCSAPAINKNMHMAAQSRVVRSPHAPPLPCRPGQIYTGINTICIHKDNCTVPGHDCLGYQYGSKTFKVSTAPGRVPPAFWSATLIASR
jgi:hypothetical protein